ncbi:MAG: hypothetical protein DRP15_02380 [Candidatus Aenigmatarchaeota archaeon]|nr:MAG: hypothetical protein DRP15_02380 [Candidatus Aenigmarchaeota archaeon]
MKALSTTILIVISAVVILIAALIVLTIFGQGVSQVSTITKFRNNCLIQARTSCQITGQLPPNWHAEVIIEKQKTSCYEEMGKCNNCNCIPGVGKPV